MLRLRSWINKYTQESSRTIKSAAIIQLTSRYSSILIGMGCELILARLLSPQDYGTLAVMLVFTTFFAMLADFGVSGAIVQNQYLDEEDINSIYAWSFRLAIVLGIGFSILSYPISLFYKDEIYRIVGCLLSLSVFFNTLNMVPSALLMKQKQFFRIGLRQVIVTLFCSFIAITLAWCGCGVFALVADSMIKALMTFVWNIKGVNLHLSLHVRHGSIKKIKKFSLNVFGFNFVNYFARNVDNLLIGKAFGTVALGNYNRAYQMMVYPMAMFTYVVTPALLPFIASHQQDKKYIYNKFIVTVKILSLLGIFISVLSFFCAREIVLILFGEQWENAVRCFQFFSISIWSQMICATSGTMFQAIGRTDLMLYRGLLTSMITILCIITGIMFCSLEETALLVSLSYYNNFFLMIYFLVKKGLQFDVLNFCCQLIPDGKIAMLLVFLFLLLCQLEYPNVVYSFALKFIIALCFYIFLLICTKQINYLLMVCPEKWRVKFNN